MRTRRRLSNARGLSAIEVALGLAILGTLMAIAVPSCVREMHASKFAEPVGGLARIGKSAVAMDAFPDSAPLTPEKTPRGKMEIDPAGTWDHPTWRALDFRATADGVPHAFSFQVDAKPDELTARAHGDLDGDGVTSTFETRAVRDKEGARIVPGMYVESEVE